MMKRIIALGISVFLYTSVAAQLQSPEEFLGYKLGDRFTRHHKVVEYYNHVAANAPNVKMEQYGETNEHRPLVVAYVSSQANFDRLDEIRENNLRRTGLVDGTAADEDIAIVWLSYNVHGNESSSTEATMWTLYELANPNNAETRKWLENTVVILDPCINPDGRDRYANFFNQYGNKIPNPNLDSKEHHEPWPGGRMNHYMFDLNRDWAWLSQVESQGRIALYNKWMPHVHVDFHEQSRNSPYYFAPAAQPYHEIITPWQREFQEIIGKNHAKYFDEEGWLYFTKEVFDLLYPSYGDTYPTYNGAIGMTYEKGGGGAAGLAGMMNNGDTVKLFDRILHHHTSGLSTVETSSTNATRLVDEFGSYFASSVSTPPGTYKTFVVKASNGQDKLNRLTTWMSKHNIAYGSSSSSNRRLTGFNYRTGSNTPVSIDAGDLVISTGQPKGKLVTALFEPNTHLVDSMTYDITAWAVPYMYDLDAYAITSAIPVNEQPAKELEFTGASSDRRTYAYATGYSSLNDVEWMAWLLNKGVKFRTAEKAFSIDGQNFDRGTMLATRWDNEHLEGFDELIAEASSKFKRTTTALKSGFVGRGKDFGSRHYRLVKAPNVAVLSGSGVSPYNFGEVWYYFENEVNYPLTVLDVEYFNRVDISKYDVIVAPSGSYRIFNEEGRKSMSEWVRNGGRLIVIDGALRSFSNTDQFNLKTVKSEEKEEEEETELTRYENAQRERLSYGTPGSIYKVKLDDSHPLAFGYRNEYFTIKRGVSQYAYLEDGWNVGVIESPTDHVAGFVGSEAKPKLGKTLVFGVENKGSGSVVYMVDNPLFRAFWYNGKMIFGNAVFIR